MRLLFTTVPLLAAVVAAAVLHDSGSAEACAGLIGSNGAVNLGRTTTLAAYHDGVEHYVTAFQFQGGGGEFGTLIPLPGVPTNVERGGGWTLQRLERETQIARLEASDTAAAGAAGGGARIPPLAGRARGARLLRRAQPDLSGRGLRRRRGSRARPADRRWDAGAYHDPDVEPVGAAAHPRPRQAGE